ncbi:A24 family peptidase [Rhodococcus sp. G-MC3]|uniref:A24 family peptidase n=1 Tax=Rhodococcus sp. G-MC3 TaxID=3046209 RepID=UPI0024B8AC1B|nr:A24 family peptidase [Rhodococcus sp. G-MC3]MDJ0395517.1 A24 family peptidase [Rhodococcus sp. G-MC3]
METFQIGIACGAGLAAGHMITALVRRFREGLTPRLLPPMVASAWTVAAFMGAGAVIYPLTLWCAVSAGVDMGSRRLPNALTASGALAMLVYAIAVRHVGTALTGALALFLCYLVVHLCVPAAFGAGDVKLAFTTGGVTALAGGDTWVSAAVLAPLLTGVLGLALTLFARARPTVPHGPSMALATLLALAAVPA